MICESISKESELAEDRRRSDRAIRTSARFTGRLRYSTIAHGGKSLGCNFSRKAEEEKNKVKVTETECIIAFVVVCRRNHSSATIVLSRREFPCAHFRIIKFGRSNVFGLSRLFEHRLMQSCASRKAQNQSDSMCVYARCARRVFDSRLFDMYITRVSDRRFIYSTIPVKLHIKIENI